MSSLINVSIDLTKIDKSRIIEGKKGGKYLNVTISVNDEPDKYGNNVSLWNGQTKEEREAKKDRLFLGNGRVIWTDGNSQSVDSSEDDDLPF